MSDNKYKMFRNFMVNELGITRDDIREWTMQAVQETVEKIVRGVDVPKMAQNAVQDMFRGFDSRYSAREAVEKAVAKTVAEDLIIAIGIKDKTPL